MGKTILIIALLNFIMFIDGIVSEQSASGKNAVLLFKCNCIAYTVGIVGATLVGLYKAIF